MVPFVFLKAIELDDFSHNNTPVHFHFTLFVFLVSGRLRFPEDPFSLTVTRGSCCPWARPHPQYSPGTSSKTSPREG